MTRTNGTGANTNQRGGGAHSSRSTSRWLMVLGVMAVAGGASGCFFDNDGPRPAPVDCAAARVVFFDWNIVKDVNNAPLTCGQANAATIVLDLGGMQADFACPFNALAGSEVSPPVLPGTYPTKLQLFDPTGALLSDTSVGVGLRAVPVPQCAGFALGTVTFGVP